MTQSDYHLSFIDYLMRSYHSHGSIQRNITDCPCSKNTGNWKPRGNKYTQIKNSKCVKQEVFHMQNLTKWQMSKQIVIILRPEKGETL